MKIPTLHKRCFAHHAKRQNIKTLLKNTPQELKQPHHLLWIVFGLITSFTTALQGKEANPPIILKGFDANNLIIQTKPSSRKPASSYKSLPKSGASKVFPHPVYPRVQNQKVCQGKAPLLATESPENLNTNTPTDYFPATNRVQIQVGFLAGLDGFLTFEQNKKSFYAKNQGSTFGGALGALFQYDALFLGLDFNYLKPNNKENRTPSFESFTHKNHIDLGLRIGFFFHRPTHVYEIHTKPQTLFYLRGGQSIHMFSEKVAGQTMRTISFNPLYIGFGFDVNLAEKIILGLECTFTQKKLYMRQANNFKASFHSVRFKIAYNISLPDNF